MILNYNIYCATSLIFLVSKGWVYHTTTTADATNTAATITAAITNTTTNTTASTANTIPTTSGGGTIQTLKNQQ